MQADLVFYVNGKKISENKPDPEVTLLRYLREKLRLSGTKLGCAEGGCGACTVMVSSYDRTTATVKHFSANACLMPVCALHGLAVTTVEGIGSTRTRLHPVQERIAKAHGSQCGFCTPGIVMSMYALLRNSSQPSMKQLEEAMQGNLCRCTGYRPIIEGYRTFTKEYDCGMGDSCCKMVGAKCGQLVDSKLFDTNDFVPYDPSQEPIFPPDLKLSDEYERQSVEFRNDRGVVWLRPTQLSELLRFKKQHGAAAKIVVGNTELGVEVKFKHFDHKFYAHPTQIREMNDLEANDDGVRVGAAVTLTDLQSFLQKQIDECKHEAGLYRSIVDMLFWFGNLQVRNVATLGGNLMACSPISDLNPLLLAAGAEVEVESVDGGRRRIKMDENFFKGYRQCAVEDSEVLLSVLIPKTCKNQHFAAYKQAKRREDDMSYVTAAFNVKFIEGTSIVEDAKVAFGGMSSTTLMAVKTGEIMKGKAWNRELIEIVNQSLIDEIPLPADAPGGAVLYRRSLTLSLFFRAFLSIGQKLEAQLNLSILEERERSGSEGFQALTPKSSQLFEKVSFDQPPTDPIHRPIVHASAFKHATGEAIYCDDLPEHTNELYLALVLSSRAHAKVVSIDESEALKQPGVHAFFSAKDVDQSLFGASLAFGEELIFAKDTVTSEGQIIGAIAADDQLIARRAARMVKVEYENLSPVIVSIEDALEHNSFFPEYPMAFKNGDIEEVFETADRVVEGEVRTGGQEHFYLETHSNLAIPRDSDEIELFSSTQQPSELQRHVANFLRIPQHKVVCRAKRVGGGFGGKETRGFLSALPVALAAYKLKRPIRMALDRDEDMMMTGGRNPILFKYKVACDREGKLLGMFIRAFLNAGYSLDYSRYVIESAYASIVNAYNFSVVHFEANVLRTNTRSNTAFRGFGAPQGMLAAEAIIRDVARVTGKDYTEIMALNMCKTGDIMHNGQLLENCNVARCYEEVLASSDFEKRRSAVAKFNAENRWKKRGISVTNNMFGVGFPPAFMNQGGALVHVYLDGTVLVSHGGVEMGQGLHTKMLQIASRVLDIPIYKIHIQETATDKVPNAISTAASVSSDLYGGAVMSACQTIYDRLTVYRRAAPKADWCDWVRTAYLDRVSLSATGFFATPDIGIEINKPKNYFTHGAAVSEVEIDCLTGDHQVLRTDIVMDVGSSLNPAIDIGQIEGAFMQGYGLFVIEELVYSPTGALLSKGPGMYKLPGFASIPAEFNVSLLTGAPNPRAVYSSRAVGEPPLFLASSVFFAIKEAIGAARHEEGLGDHFYLQSPATSERIRMACQDGITKKFSDEKTTKPWSIHL